MSHYEQRLDHDLKSIREEVGKLASMIEVAVSDSIKALMTADEELASATILRDGPINRLMRYIDRLCHQFIAVHLPSAGHLRYISSVMRVNMILERIGDYAVTISREVISVNGRLDKHLSNNIQLLASEVQGMMIQAITSFMEGNAELAKSAMKMASHVDNTVAGLYLELAETQHDWGQEERFAVFSVYHRLERISDQAKNLCEQTRFAVLGEGKADKVYRVLFIDSDNSCLSQLAAAIATKLYPDNGSFESCAGTEPAAALSPGLLEFMDSHGLDAANARPRANRYSQLDLVGFHVIVSLQAPIRTYISHPPFNTTPLNWKLGTVPEGCACGDDDYEAIHRELSIQIKDMMKLLCGKEA